MMSSKESMKVVFNASDLGLGLSWSAQRRLMELGLSEDDIDYLHRHDARLVQVVEEMGSKASSDGSFLKVADLNGTSYIITQSRNREFAVLPEDYNIKYYN